MDQSEFDADVDEDMVDPNGTLMDQVMDVLHSGGLFTIRGILNNVLMATSNVHVQECLTALESQGMVEIVGTKPFRWQLKKESSAPLNHSPKERNLQFYSSKLTRHSDTRAYNPFPGNFNSQHAPSRQDQFMEQVNMGGSSFGSKQDSRDSFCPQPGRGHLGPNSPPDKSGFQKQTNMSCPPPPPAELLKSLMSQCKLPSAPVKQAGSNMKNFEPTPNNKRGFFTSSTTKHFSLPTSSTGGHNPRLSVANNGFGSQPLPSTFPSRAGSPPSLMDASYPPGPKYPEPRNNFSSGASHPTSGNISLQSSFGQGNSVSRHAAKENNRSFAKGNNASPIACKSDPSFGQPNFSSQPHGKAFGSFNLETKSQRQSFGDYNSDQGNRQESASVASFPPTPFCADVRDIGETWATLINANNFCKSNQEAERFGIEGARLHEADWKTVRHSTDITWCGLKDKERCEPIFVQYAENGTDCESPRQTTNVENETRELKPAVF